MAKIKFGAIVVDGSGKLGGHVFSKNRGGNYLRTKTTPTNPQTAMQGYVRSIFAAISSAWSGLTANQRQSWEDRRAEYARTNIFGDLKNPNGKALFQRLNQNLMLAGESMLLVCPSSSEVVNATVSEPVLDINGPDFSVEYFNDLTGMFLLISATPPVSQGTSFVKNKFRSVVESVGGAAATVAFQAQYISKFGTPAEGDKVFVKVQTMNANGQKSPGQTFAVIVTDTTP